jgi:hypothetical protein
MNWVEPTSPPVDFTLYGLAESWAGFRWLEFFDGQLGAPTCGVRLGHQADSADSYVGVATMPRDRYDRLCVAGGDRLSEVAFYGVWWLINLTLPDHHIERPDGLAKVLLDFATPQSALHAQWPTVPWSVGDTRVSASVWRFAGGWTAFTDELADEYIAAVGFGVQPEGLGFAPVGDGARYGFDLAAPLRPSDLAVAGDRTGPPETILVNADGWHADQVAVLRTRIA